MIDDESKLREILHYSSNTKIREAAINKITDETDLAYFARHDHSDLVRWAAIRKITDKDVLTDLAKNDSTKSFKYDSKLDMDVFAGYPIREAASRRLRELDHD